MVALVQTTAYNVKRVIISCSIFALGPYFMMRRLTVERGLQWQLLSLNLLHVSKDDVLHLEIGSACSRGKDQIKVSKMLHAWNLGTHQFKHTVFPVLHITG